MDGLVTGGTLSAAAAAVALFVKQRGWIKQPWLLFVVTIGIGLVAPIVAAILNRTLLNGQTPLDDLLAQGGYAAIAALLAVIDTRPSGDGANLRIPSQPIAVPEPPEVQR